MALFERRKDDKSATPEEPAATKKVAAAPPAAPPAPPKAGAAKQAAEPEVSARSGPVIHTVAAGESLADLAGTYGVPADEIARQNHVPAPGQIYPGQVFVIRS